MPNRSTPPRLVLGVVFVCALLGSRDHRLAAEPAPPKANAKADPAAVAFFEKKIRPVLVEQCYSCHSAKAKQLRGGLLLDTRSGVAVGGESGAAVTPGDVDGSLLIQAIRYENFEMPPEGKLPAATIKDFEKWVKMGAPDPRDGALANGHNPASSAAGANIEQGRAFWSFQPLANPPSPKVRDTAWPHGDIDRFILGRLEAEGLAPARDADRRTIIRRVYFSLIGLPPSPEQIEAFVADDAPEALSKVVDQLLAAPEFGERWGRHWLDVARFAESSGGGRTLMFDDAWRYRDYVIDAFNQDRPFNEFAMEQIAGDLMPADSPQQRGQRTTGTGFLVLGPTNYELQDKELLRMEVVDEQLDTMGRAFLGLTIGCARCHDHKFDPISHRDYYALAGILRGTKTLTPGNVAGYVTTDLPVEPAHRAALDAHAKVIREIEGRLTPAQTELKRLQRRLAGVAPDLKLQELSGVVIDNTQAKLVGEWKRSTSTKPFFGPDYIHDENTPDERKSATYAPKLPAAGEYEVRLSYSASANRAARATVTIVHADGQRQLQIDQRKQPPIDGQFLSVGKFRFAASGAEVILSNENAGGHVIADVVQFLPTKPGATRVAHDDETPDAKSQAQQARLKKLVAASESAVKALTAELAKAKKNAPPPASKVMSVRDEAETGDYAIAIRGNPHNLGAPVPRGFLSVVESGPVSIPKGQSGRLQLAQWVASKDNPLTARVFVNRVWLNLFGEGLVRTPDNFGKMGQPPSHPKLLDYLASDFMEHGWSVKRLIRQIVLSHTYRQASQASATALAADPQNKLLSRMARRRLDAEAIRDSVLSFSGRLSLDVGGRSFPQGSKTEFGFNFDTTRRSVYVPAFRNTMHELFEVFDFANPNLVSGQRNTSTLPTQALYLMNSPFAMQEAQAAASRLLAEKELDDAQRIDLAYRRALGRAPRPDEHELTMRFLGSRAAEHRNAQQGRLEAWTGVCQALIACLDFRYVN